MTLKEHRFYDNDNIDDLNVLICQFLDDSFRNSPLTDRLTISYKKNMEEIKPSYSFILYTDEYFLNTNEVRDILGNFRELKKQIMKNQNDDESFFNPILKDDSSDNMSEEEDDNDDNEYEDIYDFENMDMNIWEIYHSLKTLKGVKCLPKRGVSLMSNKERQKIKSNSNMKFSSVKSFSHEHFDIKTEHYKFKEIKVKGKHKNKYTKLIKEIFCEKLNDFRSEIVI